MTFKSIRKSALAAAFGALLATGVGIGLQSLPIGRGLINWSYDRLFFARGSVMANEAVIVYLDDASFVGGDAREIAAVEDRILQSSGLD